MLKTVLAGVNLDVFRQQVENQEIKKMENIALLTEDFIPTLKILIENNYKIEIIALEDTTIIEDKPLHIINIKLQK